MKLTRRIAIIINVLLSDKMLDFLTALLQQHSLLLMFTSAFLSATVLPGNSEVVFVALAAGIQLPAEHYISLPALWLLLSAVAGNSLGSLTTYWIGRWLPRQDFSRSENHKVRWVFDKIEKHGALVLLLSWLPVVGDLFCAVAGWLRLNWLSSFIYILIGKTLRYVFLLYLVIGYTFL